MPKKVKAKLKPYNSLKDSFTQVANTMLFYIADPYTFKIYVYLCMRYNTNYNYAFPSYTTISKDCSISLSKTKECVKWLCENKYIVKAKLKDGEGYTNNIYYIRYIEIDKTKLEEDLVEERELDYQEEVEVVLGE